MIDSTDLRKEQETRTPRPGNELTRSLRGTLRDVELQRGLYRHFDLDDLTRMGFVVRTSGWGIRITEAGIQALKTKPTYPPKKDHEWIQNIMSGYWVESPIGTPFQSTVASEHYWSS